MPTNIESFVKTLESEGVEAGKRAADQIEAKAKENAAEIVAEAKKKAEEIIAQAQSDAEKVQARMNSSLQLATRDAIALLRQKLAEQLKGLMEVNVENALNNEQVLSNVISEVIPLYAKADADKTLAAQINISKDLKSRLLENAVRELAHSLKKQDVQLTHKYALSKAGFEFKIEASTLEVSTESVTALLSEMIDPELQQFLDKAAEAEA